MRAIIWRDFKVAFGNLFTLLAQFIGPIFILLFFATAFSASLGRLAQYQENVSYLEYFIPGLFGYVTFLLFSLSSGFIRMDKQTGMLAVITLSRTSLQGYYWGKLIVQIVLTMLKILVLGIMGALLSGYMPVFDPGTTLIFIAALIASVTIWLSLGIMLGIYCNRPDMREIILMLLTLPLTFASSMYYNINLIPKVIRGIAIFNPLTYTCNIFRGCYLNSPPEDLLRQIVILFVVAIILLFVTLLSLKRINFSGSSLQ
jgi:ABC-2 type transport system permease protein